MGRNLNRARIRKEIGFDALYVKSNEAFDQVEAATLLLHYPALGSGTVVRTVHRHINLWNAGHHGEFPTGESHFAAPFDSDTDNFAVRFTGYIYAPSPGIRYFGVNSDEGFTLIIGSRIAGQYASGREAATSDVTKNLSAGTMSFDFPEAGRYYLALDYFENNGGESIELFQTDATGGNRRLINVDSELVVFRDDVVKINATNIVVEDEHTLTCRIDLDRLRPGNANLLVTPALNDSGKAFVEDAFAILPCTSDFNGDHLVDFLDWAKMARSWGENCSEPDWCTGFDLDLSKDVGPADLAIFVQSWLENGD